MSQIRGTAGYNLGAQNRFSAPGRAEATNDPSPLDTIREQTSKIEDWLDTLAEPVKPYVRLFSALPFFLGVPNCQAIQVLPLMLTRGFMAIQISTSYWTLPDRRHFLGRCSSNYNPMDRSAGLSPRLSTQYVSSRSFTPPPFHTLRSATPSYSLALGHTNTSAPLQYLEALHTSSCSSTSSPWLHARRWS